MMVRLTCVLVLAIACSAALATDTFDNAGVRIALRVYDECSKADGFSPCLKKKAITFLTRLGRMDKFTLGEGVTVVRAEDGAPAADPAAENAITEEQLEKSLPRAADARDSALDTMLMDKLTAFVSSRSIQVTLPKLSAEDFGMEEGRGKKMKGMMHGMMMGIAAKMATLIPVSIAGLFLLAGKALIIAKIALLLSGIIAIKKLLASKQGGGGGGHGGGGHGGGWSSGGSGGGWDKRSFDEAQKMAYSAYAPQ